MSRTTFISAALAALGFLSATTAWAGAAGAPPGAFELGVRLEALAEKDPDLKTLLGEALIRAGKSTVGELFTDVRPCDPKVPEYAAMKQDAASTILYFGRVLEEPSEAGKALQDFYAERFKEDLAGITDARWDFEPDLIVVTRATTRRVICLRPGERLETSVDAMIHELVHYARLPLENGPDILDYSGLDDYATRTVQQPGDEVEAYILQYTIALRFEGRVALGASPMLSRLFSAEGLFAGPREDMVTYVLDELGYRRKRFEPEYRDQLAQALARARQRRQFLAQFLESRTKQLSGAQQAYYARSRLWGLLSVSYEQETKRLSKQLDKVDASVKRLKAALDASDERIQKLQARQGS